MDSDELSNYRGLAARSPMVAAILVMFMLSLTGIPPLGGFIGKLYLFSAAVEAKYYWLVVLAVLNSVVSFVYYGGIVKRMYLEEGPSKAPIRLSLLPRSLLTILAILILLMGIYWTPVAKYSEKSVQMLLKAPPVAQKR
jgi:NADH-quinone oxidoreductase subunit N